MLSIRGPVWAVKHTVQAAGYSIPALCRGGKVYRAFTSVPSASPCLQVKVFGPRSDSHRAGLPFNSTANATSWATYSTVR